MARKATKKRPTAAERREDQLGRVEAHMREELDGVRARLEELEPQLTIAREEVDFWRRIAAERLRYATSVLSAVNGPALSWNDYRSRTYVSVAHPLLEAFRNAAVEQLFDRCAITGGELRPGDMFLLGEAASFKVKVKDFAPAAALHRVWGTPKDIDAAVSDAAAVLDWWREKGDPDFLEPALAAAVDRVGELLGPRRGDNIPVRLSEGEFNLPLPKGWLWAPAEKKLTVPLEVTRPVPPVETAWFDKADLVVTANGRVLKDLRPGCPQCKQVFNKKLRIDPWKKADLCGTCMMPLPGTGQDPATWVPPAPKEEDFAAEVDSWGDPL